MKVLKIIFLGAFLQACSQPNSGPITEQDMKYLNHCLAEYEWDEGYVEITTSENVTMEKRIEDGYVKFDWPSGDFQPLKIGREGSPITALGCELEVFQGDPVSMCYHENGKCVKSRCGRNSRAEYC